jgi:hypothetical protein
MLEETENIFEVAQTSILKGENMVKINQKVIVKPFKHMVHSGTGGAELELELEGIIKYVNATHRWFSVEYGEYGQRIAYKFDDIGKSVFLCE